MESESVMDIRSLVERELSGLFEEEAAPDQLTIRIPLEKYIKTIVTLRETEGLDFNYLSDITALHLPDRKPPFDLVVHLYSLKHFHRIRIKAAVSADDTVPSLTQFWFGANWHEREMYDMFGIHNIEGHPDLRRILLPDEWKGHPLRKDYPVASDPELEKEIVEKILKESDPLPGDVIDEGTA